MVEVLLLDYTEQTVRCLMSLLHGGKELAAPGTILVYLKAVLTFEDIYNFFPLADPDRQIQNYAHLVNF